MPGSRRRFTLPVVLTVVVALCGPAAGAAPQPAAPDGLPDRLQGRVLTQLRTDEKVVALTIDCGAGRSGLPPILEALGAAGVPATFFVTGEFARNHPRSVRRMSREGHRVGNHSDTHPDFRTIAGEEQTRQVAAAQREIIALGLRSPTPLFRFPFGSSDAGAIRRVNELGYAAVGWTVDSLGWQGTSGGQTRRSVFRRVTAAATPGEIVLMHAGANPRDGTTLDADALPRIITWFSRHGYSFDVLRRGNL